MAIADYNYCLTCIDVGCNGVVSDGGVYPALENGLLPEGYCLVGDDAVPLKTYLTLILLTWTIWRAPTNTSKWRMVFNSAFKGLKLVLFDYYEA